MNPKKTSANKPSPRESRYFNALVDWLVDEGLNIDEVHRFMWGIAALSDLSGLRCICRRLGHIFELMEQVQPNFLIDFEMSNWNRIASKIERITDHVAKSCGFGEGFLLEAKLDKRHLLRGKGATYRPIYVALPCISPIAERDPEENYAYLQGMALLAEWMLLRGRSSLKDYLQKPANALLYEDDGRVVRAGLGLRHLSESEATSVALKLPRPSPPREYLLSLAILRASLDNAREPDVLNSRDQLMAVENLLYAGFGNMPRRERSGAANPNTKGGSPFVDGTLEVISGKLVSIEGDDDDDDPGTNGGFTGGGDTDYQPRPKLTSVELPLFSPGSDPDSDDDSTEPPGELRRPGRLIFVDTENVQGDRATNWRRLEAQVRYAEVRNQMLPGAWESLSDHEAQILRASLLDKYRSTDGADPHQRQLKDGCLASLLTLTYGRKMEELGTLKYYEERPLDIFGPIYIVKERCFVFPVPAPNNKDLHRFINDPEIKDVGLLPRLQQFFTVPDHTGLGELIKDLRRFPVPSPPTDRVFSFPSADLKRLSRHLIRQVPMQRRVTLGMLTRYSFNAAVQQRGGDVAEATVSTGNTHQLSSVALHYYAPVANVLSSKQKFFIDEHLLGVKPLDPTVSTSKKSFTNKPADGPVSTKVLGHQAVPMTWAIKAALSELRTILEQISPWSSWSDYTTYHNFYVLYTWLQESYLNGIRAIQDPFIPEKECDSETGFARLSDKDNDRHYHSRLVWLPPTYWKQRRNYQQHREVIVDEAKRRGFFDSQRLESKSYFFLGSDHKVRPFTPRFFKQPGCFEATDDVNHAPFLPLSGASILRALLKLPLNVNRRYLRSALVAKGCQVESVQAHLGHWNSGEEPWAPYSSFSMSAHTKVMQFYLGMICDDIGAKPVESRIA